MEDDEDFFWEDEEEQVQTQDYSHPGTEFDNLPFFREPEIREEVEEETERRRREEEAQTQQPLDASAPTPFSADPYGGAGYMPSSGPQGLVAPQAPPDWSNADEIRLAKTAAEKDQIEAAVRDRAVHPQEVAEEAMALQAERSALQQRKQAFTGMQQQQAEQMAEQQATKQNALLTSMQQKNAVVDTELFDRKYKSVVDPETGRFVHFYQPEPGKWAQVKTEGAPQEATVGEGGAFSRELHDPNKPAEYGEGTHDPNKPGQYQLLDARQPSAPGRDVPADGKVHQVAPNVAVSAGRPREPSLDELKQDYMRVAGPYRVANGERNFEEAARLKPAHDEAFAKWQQAEKTERWNNRYLGDPAAGFQQTESQRIVGEMYKSGKVPSGKAYQDAMEDLALQKEGIDPKMVKPSLTEQAFNERRAATIAAPGTRQHAIALQNLNNATIERKQQAARQEAIAQRQVKAEQFKIEKEQRQEQAKLQAEAKKENVRANARYQTEVTKQHNDLQNEIDKVRLKKDNDGKMVPMTDKEFQKFAQQRELAPYLLDKDAHRAEAERRATAATQEAYPDWKPKQEAKGQEPAKPAERTSEQIQVQSESVNRQLSRLPAETQKEAGPIIKEIERIAASHPQGIQSARPDVQEYAAKLRSQLVEIEARSKRDTEGRIAEADQMPIPWDKVPMESFGAP